MKCTCLSFHYENFKDFKSIFHVITIAISKHYTKMFFSDQAKASYDVRNAFSK